MKPTTPSPTPALLDRCHEIAQQEAALREGGGAAGQERPCQPKHRRRLKHKRPKQIPRRPFGYFKFDDELSGLASRAEPSFAPIQR